MPLYEWDNIMKKITESNKSHKRLLRRILSITAIVLILLLPFLINGILLTESWGFYRSKQWFNRNRDELARVSNNLVDYLDGEADVSIPSTYTDYLSMEPDEEMSEMALPYDLKSIWMSNESTAVAYSYESSGYLVTTTASYGVYYSENDEPLTVIDTLELSGNKYATKRLEENWYFWWVLY